MLHAPLAAVTPTPSAYGHHASVPTTEATCALCLYVLLQFPITKVWWGNRRRNGWLEEFLLEFSISNLWKIVQLNIYRRFPLLANKYSSVLNTLSSLCSCTSPMTPLICWKSDTSPQVWAGPHACREAAYGWTAVHRAIQGGERQPRLAIDFQRRSLYHPRLWYPICLRVGPRTPIWDEKTPDAEPCNSTLNPRRWAFSITPSTEWMPSHAPESRRYYLSSHRKFQSF